MISPRHCRNGALACAALMIAGCASNPSEEPVPPPVAAPATAPAPAPAGKPAPAPAAQNAGDGTAVPVDANAPPAGPIIPPRAAAQFDQALALLAAGKAQDAELEFKTLIVAYPEFPAPHVNLGLIYLRANKFADAEREFQAALQAAPQDARALAALGLTYRHLGRFQDAEKAYTGALASDPANLGALRNLGVLYDLYLQKPDKALPLYQKYQELSGGGDKQVAEWIKDVSRRAGATPKPVEQPAAQPAEGNGP